MRCRVGWLLIVLSGCSAELELHDVERPSAQPRIVDLAVDEMEACGVAASGELYCWPLASVRFGGHHELPRRIAIEVPVVDVEPGGGHTCALTEDGRVACWGFNTFGEVDASRERTEPEPEGVAFCLLGEPDDADAGNVRSVPTFVEGLDEVVALAVGGRHNCALEAGGELTCWGQNDHESLGGPTAGESFQKVTTRHAEARGVVVAWLQSCVIDGRGHPQCFGAGGLPAIPDLAFRQLELANGRSCGITTADELVCWGAPDDCGLDETGHGVWRVPGARVQDVAIGEGNCIDCFVEKGGNAFCWPSIASDDDDEDDGTPWSSLDRVPLDDVAQIGLASNDACARTEDGEVWCWHTSDGDPREEGRLRKIEFPE